MTGGQTPGSRKPRVPILPGSIRRGEDEEAAGKTSYTRPVFSSFLYSFAVSGLRRPLCIRSARGCGPELPEAGVVYLENDGGWERMV